MSDLDLAQLVSPRHFQENHPKLVTESSLRWQLRHRDTNGLAAAGAVLEVRQRADQRRPRLLIHPERYAQVLFDQRKYLRRTVAA